MIQDLGAESLSIRAIGICVAVLAEEPISLVWTNYSINRSVRAMLLCDFVSALGCEERAASHVSVLGCRDARELGWAERTPEA